MLSSAFVFGGLLIGAVRLPAAWAIGVVGLFAAFHGYARALEAPENGAGTYILGLLLAMTLLQGLGLGLAWAIRRAVDDMGLRAMDRVMLAAGAVALISN